MDTEDENILSDPHLVEVRECVKDCVAALGSNFRLCYDHCNNGRNGRANKTLDIGDFETLLLGNFFGVPAITSRMDPITLFIFCAVYPCDPEQPLKLGQSLSLLR